LENVREINQIVVRTIEELSPPEWSFVFTHHRIDSEVHRSYDRRLEEVAKNRASTFLPVVLTCDHDVLLKRVTELERRLRNKLIDPSIAENIVDQGMLVPDRLLSSTSLLDRPLRRQSSYGMNSPSGLPKRQIRQRLTYPAFGDGCWDLANVWVGRQTTVDESSIRGHLAQLVEDLVARHALSSESVGQAFLAVPRHLFVPETPVDEAYLADRAIPTHFDERGVSISSSSAPSIMAIMLELLRVAPGQRVLEIGAGTGYNAALLAHLVGEAGSVTTIDIDEEVAREASGHLAEVGVEGVEVLCQDGWLGEDRSAPFDRIIATVECWDISPHWFGQLGQGGVLVLPLALGPGLTMAVAFEKVGQSLISRSMAYCGFMPLRGPHAGPENRALVSRSDEKASGLTEDSKWLAVFPDATPERRDILQGLLAGGVTRTAAAPPLITGWNVRLVLEEPDPIYLFEVGAEPPRTAMGLFDSDRRSLALVEGATITSFGSGTCLERIVDCLSAAKAFDLLALRITATSNRPSHDKEDVVFLGRPSFTLAIEGLS
jgi:protein-L-isoaspartate(D-aspartate) O-methyltransferase